MAANGKPKPKPKPPGAGPAPPPPPPPPPPTADAKKGFMRRMFPFLLAVNLLVGAYVVVRTYYKDSPKSGTAESDPATTATADKSTPEPVAAAVPVKVFPPIPEDEQRRVYKWILEEKRKVKPRDKAEKRKLDDEKALLKQIIRGESLPKL